MQYFERTATEFGVLWGLGNFQPASTQYKNSVTRTVGKLDGVSFCTTSSHFALLVLFGKKWACLRALWNPILVILVGNGWNYLQG